MHEPQESSLDIHTEAMGTAIIRKEEQAYICSSRFHICSSLFRKEHLIMHGAMRDCTGAHAIVPALVACRGSMTQQHTVQFNAAVKFCALLAKSSGPMMICLRTVTVCARAEEWRSQLREWCVSI